MEDCPKPVKINYAGKEVTLKYEMEYNVKLLFRMSTKLQVEVLLHIVNIRQFIQQLVQIQKSIPNGCKPQTGKHVLKDGLCYKLPSKDWHVHSPGFMSKNVQVVHIIMEQDVLMTEVGCNP